MTITERIKSGPTLLFDGAIGSLLIDRGLPAGKAPEAWVLENPEAIGNIHREYVDAGAEVIAACTFGGNRLRLKKGSLDGRLTEINRRAIEIAHGAAGDDIYLAADIGPTGEFFQPVGTLDEATAREVYEEQAAILADTSLDLFLLETHYDLKEALICLEACRKAAPDIPIGALLTFNSTPKGYFTVMGNPAVESLKALADAGAFLVGANCTLEAKAMAELASHLAPQIDTPLLFQANAGTPEITPDGVIYPQGPDVFCYYAADMLKSGINAIGGCCGTTPAHISTLRALIDSELQ